MVRFGAAALAVAAGCAVAVLGLALAHVSATWISLPAGLGAGGLALTGWLAWRTSRRPASKLCLFRDRILLIDGGRVTTVLWPSIEVATLASGGLGPWTAGDVRLGDRLTLQLRPKGRSLQLRPADFGLEASLCRDLILELRDDLDRRGGLPEFDSALDLRGRPATAGELNRPAL